ARSNCVSSFFCAVISLLIDKTERGEPSLLRTSVDQTSAVNSRRSFVISLSSPRNSPVESRTCEIGSSCPGSDKLKLSTCWPRASSSLQLYKRSSPRFQNKIH